MILQEMANSTSQWLRGDGPEAEIVFSCRVRLARNLEGFTFPPWATNSVLRDVSDKVLNAVNKSDYLKNSRLINMSELSGTERRFLLERHLISPEFSAGAPHRFLVTEKGEMISLMVNEEDHVRLQSILSGLQLIDAWRLTDKVDDELERNLDYAFLPQWGYLTSCPTNTGTGMRASCMLHLPALVATHKTDELLKNISKLGLVARGLYGEGTKSQGDFFQISNQVTLGLREEEIVDNVERVTRQVVGQEKKAREILLKRNGTQLKDQMGRAYGTLINAYLMSSEEAINLLSKLRLGVSLHLFPQLNVQVLNELFFMITPAQLQVKKGKEMAPLDRDELRAKIIRGRLGKLK
jgi:protein arginine kinase